MNTILTVQLEDLDDNPPEFEFEEKTGEPRSKCAYAKRMSLDRPRYIFIEIRDFIEIKYRIQLFLYDYNLSATRVARGSLKRL